MCTCSIFLQPMGGGRQMRRPAQALPMQTDGLVCTRTWSNFWLAPAKSFVKTVRLLVYFFRKGVKFGNSYTTAASRGVDPGVTSSKESKAFSLKAFCFAARLACGNSENRQAEEVCPHAWFARKDHWIVSRAAHVFGPTIPSGTRPWSRWKARTAASVFGPKLPS